MRPSNDLQAILALATCGALAACSSPSSAPSAAQGSPGSPSTQAAGPLEVTGTWLLCDAAAQEGRSDYAGGGNYIAPGGWILDVSVNDGVASAVEIGGDGGPVYVSSGWVDDAGTDCDGSSCGETDIVLSGPLDPSTRVWSAGFLWPHGNVSTYPARIVFSADGTRFTGDISAYDEQVAVFGGRDDGSFSCGSGAP
jgi:hypothetical protein